MTLGLISCSAGGSSFPAVQPPIAPGSRSAATSAVFMIQVPRATSVSSASRNRKPQYVSASTQSIAIATNGQIPVVANLTPTSPGCVAATLTKPLTCTLTQPATIGADSFTLTLYDGLSGKGNVLSTATLHQTINSGHSNTIHVTLNGVVSTLQLSLSNPNPPVGMPATITLNVSALDVDGNIIIAPGNYVNASGSALPVTLSDSDLSGVTKLNGTTLSSPSTPASTLSYNGSPLPSGATITASATGVAPVTALFAPQSPATSKIYVTNYAQNSITDYAPNPIGILNEAPLGTIVGNSTGLFSPLGIAVDASGNIIIANNDSSNSVTVYAPNPIGFLNEAPFATIAGSNTQLTAPAGIALDASGKVYVTNNGAVPSINVYAFYLCFFCGPVLNEAPLATITGSNTSLNSPYGIAVDASGKIYVGNQNGNSITVYAANPSGTLNEAPLATITGSSTGLSRVNGIALDASGRIYVANQSVPSITVYAANPIGTLNEVPLATITGSNTGLNQPWGVALDPTGNIYITNASQGSVTVYAPNPIGTLNEAPLGTITGSNTGLVAPFGIAIPVLAPTVIPTAVPVFTEYPLPSATSAPYRITAGPDGALWFTERGNVEIGRMTTTGSVTEYPIPNPGYGNPGGITAGPDGALWFTEFAGNSGYIGRITIDGSVTQYALSYHSQPSAITVGPDGALWFNNQNVSGGVSIGRITTSGTVTEYPIASETENGITTGPDGALWFTNSKPWFIAQMTTSGIYTDYPGAFPTTNGITTGPDGALWVTEPYEVTLAIARMTTGGSVTEYPIPTANAQALFIAVGLDGALWFTEFDGSKIGRITTDGSVTEYSLPTASGSPTDLTVGADGALWFSELANGKIGRLGLASASSPGRISAGRSTRPRSRNLLQELRRPTTSPAYR